jgi:chromosome segregation ATPase
MKYRVGAFAVLAVLGVLPSVGQTSQADSQAIQAILSEVRDIHEEMKVAETAQILLTELGLQQSVVTRATQRVDEAQSNLQTAQSSEKELAAQMSRAQERLDQTTDPTKRSDILNDVTNFKDAVAVERIDEQNYSDRLQNAQQQLLDAQDELNSIQGQLNTIVKGLNPASR